MKDDIMVSVSCIVYNHEPYLRKCLDSLVNQKTDFKYEILVHDDASTDGSTDIIREFELKYPDLIKPIYQSENQYSKGVKIDRTYQLSRANGKYIAICEGDDYWVDIYKLQKQYDALEENSNCKLCVHKTRVVKENGELTNDVIPKKAIDCGVIKSEDFYHYIFCIDGYPFHTSSYFYPKNIVLKNDAVLHFSKGLSFGDIPFLLAAALMGDIYFIDDEMSYYRSMSKGSWSYRRNKADTTDLEQNLKLLERFNEYTHFKYSEWIEVSKLRKIYYYNIENQNYARLVKRDLRPVLKKELNLKERIYIYYQYILCLMRKRKTK